MYIIHYHTYKIMKLILLSLILYITCVNALNPVCRGRLRSDLKFKYSYDGYIIDSSKDIDFNQRGDFVRCASSGTQVYTIGGFGSANCDSVATGEGPGLDRFGWASQTMVGKEGSVKFYTPFDSLATADQEFTTGTKCGTKVVLPTGAVWGAAVCEKAVHLYFYDDTQWLDRGEIAFPDATGNDIDIDVNHEDYLIVRAGSKVFIYKLGMFPEKIHEENGDGLVAASVNCKGSVFAYESSGAIKLKQLDQSDGTSWSNLADVTSSAISMEMSSDVLAVGTTGKVQLYLFANGGTSYDEYKAIDGLASKNFGKKLALKHDNLAIIDDDHVYRFKETTPVKCLQNHKLVNGECVACEGTESSALDTTSSTCTPLTCSANQYISNGACTACPGGYTSAGGSVTECVCGTTNKFISVSGECKWCPSGSTSTGTGLTECGCWKDAYIWDSATESCVGIKCAADERVNVDIKNRNSKIVAVGNKGTIYSHDLASNFSHTTFLVQTSGTTETLQAIAHGNWKYVAVGAGIPGVIITSSNGNDWSAPTTTPSAVNHYKDILWNDHDGIFIALNYQGRIVRGSADVTIWTLINDVLRLDQASGHNGIAYGAGEYIVTNDHGKVYVSSDLETWTTLEWDDIGLSASGVQVKKPAYGNGKFVVPTSDGKVLVSASPVTNTSWSSHTLDASHNYGISFAHGYFFAVGNYDVEISIDGENWSKIIEKVADNFKSYASTAVQYDPMGDEWLIAGREDTAAVGRICKSSTPSVKGSWTCNTFSDPNEPNNQFFGLVIGARGPISCEACPAGSTNEAGDDQSHGSTLCDVTACAITQHVVSNVCTQCPTGGSRAAGDLPTGADTLCNAIVTCAVDQYYDSAGLITRTEGPPSGDLSQVECEALQGFSVTDDFNKYGDHPGGCIEIEYPVGTFTINYNTNTSQNCDVLDNAKCIDADRRCNDCPAGSTKSPAVDSLGGDSTCDAILCAENEHVESNVCTACPAGSERAAGDDATGADTFCTCPADSRVTKSYVSDTKKYGSTSCTDNSDCETKCDADSSCSGYTNNGFSTIKAWGKKEPGVDPGVINNVVKITGNMKAFAALKADGSITTWGCKSTDTGEPCYGYEYGGTDPGIGAGSGIVDIVSNVKQHAFAALKNDGSVHAWGDSNYGGCNNVAGGTNTKCVPDGLSNVATIVSNHHAFVAVKSDGSVKAWGDSGKGGSDPGIASGVNIVVSNDRSFAALKSDGSVQAWGDSNYGGCTNAAGGTNTKCVPDGLSNVASIASTSFSYTALKTDGSVVSWGYSGRGGDGAPSGSDFVKVVGVKRAFAALKSDGAIETWGYSVSGGSGVSSGTSCVYNNGEYVSGTSCTKYIQADHRSEGFAALKSDGKIETWGSGFSNSFSGSGYVKLFGQRAAFAAIKSDGSVKVHGDSGAGGTDPGIGAGTNCDYDSDGNYLSGTGCTKDIKSTEQAFVAIKSDGTIKAWGHNHQGGCEGSGYTYATCLETGLTGIDTVFATNEAFVAVSAASITYGPKISGTGSSFKKSGICSTCGTNEERPAGDPTDGPDTQCSCAAGTEGDGSGCQACPANSNAIGGHIKDICVKNEAAIWDHAIAANHGNCDSLSLDCSTLVGDPSTCIQPYEDGGNLQIATPCCQIEKRQKCTCDENFRVASGVCTACIGGKTRPAGDDPDGVNTYCSTEGIGLAFGNNGDTDFTYLGQNDPVIELKVGQKYSFLRDTAGHPLRIVSEEDCAGKDCDTGTYSSLPTSSVSNVDAEQGVANIVWTPKRAGTYYYLCTSHPAMLGTITVTWDTCNFPHKGAFSLTQSCKITTDFALQGDMLINAPSARLRSTDEKPLLSYEAGGAMSIDGGSYKFEMHNVEVQPPESSYALIKGSGDIILNNVDIKESGEWRDSDRDGVFTSDGGKIVAQNMAIHNVAGLSFKATGGGDISLADVTISGSYTGNSDSYQSNYDFSEAVIGVKGGAITMRNVQMTGGWKLAQMEDATSLFEAVTMDGNKGIKGKNTAIQMERSTIKNLDGDDAIDLDNSGQDNKDKELFISNSTIKDNRGDTNGPISVKVHSTTSYRSKIKLIEVDFSGNKKADNTARDIYSNNAASLYVVDPVSDPTISGPSLKEECYDHQCAHKPLASTCKVEAGKGTKCSCEVGVATYNSGTMSFERQTHLKEVLSTLFATADVGDRIVKLVDRQSRYTPASATPEEAKSNLILTKPTNTDGKFVSEKTILMKPATGQLCTSFRTWLCNELTMCHYSNGTITADCDGTKILTPSSNAATRRLRSIHKWKVLKAVHPDDPNCAGSITNLKQQCTANVNGNAESYERCVRGAHFVFNDCKCQDGTVPNSGLTACVNPNDACRQNERVFQGRCVACPAGTSNIAGDDRTGGNTVCDDVVCATSEYADGTGLCKPCAAGTYNIAGDIALNKGTGAQITSSCCPSDEYETAYTPSAGTRTCAACSGIKTAYIDTLKCCSGQKLGDSTYDFQCPRIMEYWRNVCSQADNTCPARNY